MKLRKILSLPVKIVLWIIAIILIIIIGVNAYLCYIGFPPQIKDMVTEQMAKQLHRPVQIQKIGFCILKGFIIRNVKIWHKKPFYNKNKPFVQVKAIVCKYDLSEIFKKKIKVEKVTLEYPVINIKRYLVKKKPVFNFSDLLPPVPKQLPAEGVEEEKPKQEKETPSRETKEKKKTGPAIPKITKSQIPIDLQVDKVGLENANIEIEDTATPKFREIYKLENVHCLVENIKLKANSPINLRTGFGLSVTEYEKGKKARTKAEIQTAKDINIEAFITGVITLFNKKGILNPTGSFNLGLKNGKFSGIQAYNELRNQADDINKSITKYQEKLLNSFNKIKAQAAQLEKTGKLGSQVGGIAEQAETYTEKLAKMDMSFIKGALEWKFLKKDLQFDEVKTTIKIKNWKVKTEDLKAGSTDFSILGGGWTSIKNMKLSYNLDLLADKKYNKNDITDALASEEGNLSFPIKISGTVSDIKIEFVKDEIIKTITTTLQKKFMSMIKTRAGGIEDMAKQMMKKYLGEYAKYVDMDASSAKEALEGTKDKLQDEAKAKLSDAERKARREARKKKREAKRKLEEEKRKQEEALKKKAEEEGKKALEGFLK